MNLKTRYMGLELANPFVAGASFFSKDADAAKKLEDAGAAAMVLPSLFEEQIMLEKLAAVKEMEAGTESFGEALSYLPEPESLKFGSDIYVENLRKIKKAVDIPVIASLNGYTYGGWANNAKMLEEAGADAIELNVYFAPTSPYINGLTVEKTLVSIAKLVTSIVKIPVSVKLSSQYSSVANVCERLVDEADVKGLVLFNRFFNPDIDIESLEMKPTLKLSTSDDLPLRLAWIGALSGKVKASLSLTGGVHTVEDAVKAIMAGTDTIQVVSALVGNGVEYLGVLKEGLADWLAKNGYTSLEQLSGSMSFAKCPNPEVYQRLNYMRLLKTWQDL
ncbi:MAG: dihydroorotate dehydrogenase-like protein [Alphaproteobacteria bacterium]